MGGLGGLYRPTPQGYNGNLAGCWARLSVSPASGFSANRWGPPPSGPRRSVGAAYYSRAVGDEGLVIFSVAIVPPPGGRSL